MQDRITPVLIKLYSKDWTEIHESASLIRRRSQALKEANRLQNQALLRKLAALVKAWLSKTAIKAEVREDQTDFRALFTLIAKHIAKQYAEIHGYFDLLVVTGPREKLAWAKTFSSYEL
ncbi:uncharacterized protein B0I36DRAFT_355841 [Microdochium trichocladiopsis]|uniref:Uncharacterized protein n=1 Tax=Microdochium trichocladiopsis TaxID=1682393 RepID=A0A9P9BIM2_9PEZI|nr:uncharacterized protein B0I36DRAFT_355841 [Microdochium trichocladiopsis]KAH7012428.1 hypothetical protein B0I36DRAFT_355841 [Microdochium trichocladiopsis]